jgi:hypothetical protein
MMGFENQFENDCAYLHNTALELAKRFGENQLVSITFKEQAFAHMLQVQLINKHIEIKQDMNIDEISSFDFITPYGSILIKKEKQNDSEG